MASENEKLNFLFFKLQFIILPTLLLDETWHSLLSGCVVSNWCRVLLFLLKFKISPGAPVCLLHCPWVPQNTVWEPWEDIFDKTKRLLLIALDVITACGYLKKESTFSESHNTAHSDKMPLGFASTKKELKQMW